MSFLNQNPNASPYANHGPAPLLEGVAASPGSRPAPFSQPFVPQAGGPSDPPALNFQVARSLRMHKKLAWMVGLGVCLLLIAVGLKQPRTYTASSVIYVEPMVAQALNEQGGAPGFDQFRYSSFLDQQMQTIVRPDVLAAALRTLPAGTWRGPTESEQSAVARLSKALTVERVLTSYQITVQLKTGNPEAAAAIVNAVTNAYLQRGREDEFKQADLREQILSEERDRIRQELNTDRREQAALGASMGVASPAEGAINPYDSDLANLRTQLATARQARDVAAAQLASVSGQAADQRSGLTAAADDALLTDPGLTAKRAAVNARRVVLESMMAGMTPSNPQYRQAQDEIADLDRALEARTSEVRAQAERHVQDKLRTDLERTAEVESKLNGQLAEATAKATGAAPKLQRAAELSNDIQRLTARYSLIDEALNALQIQTSGPGMAHVPLPAAVPLTPDPNRRNLFFMAALPLGLLFGISAAVVARLRDRRVYLGSDLRQAIGFAPIAVLPSRADVSGRVIEEYVLRLAAGVESAYRTAGAQSFVVTAVSAKTDIRALLNDLANRLGDLRLRVYRTNAPELLITSRETLEHLAANPGLTSAGAASQSAQAGEGIASAKLDRLKRIHDIILIEAAPVLHSAETEYAARCADATLLVAESAVTQSTELSAAIELLSRLRVSGVGAVLDQVALEQADEPFRSAVRVVEQRSLERASPQTQPAAGEAVVPVRDAARPAPVAGTSAGTAPASQVLARPVARETAQEDPKPGNIAQRREVPAAQEPKPALKPVLAPAPVLAQPEPVPAEPVPILAELATIEPTKKPILSDDLDILPRELARRAPAEAEPVAPAAFEPVQTRNAPSRPLSPAAAEKDVAAQRPVRPTVPQFAPATATVPPPAAAPRAMPVALAVPAPPALPAVAEPGISAPASDWPEREPAASELTLPRSLRSWKVDPEISPAEAEQVAAKTGARRRFELLEELAEAGPVLSPAAATPVTESNGDLSRVVAPPPVTVNAHSQPEPQRAALHAASARMQRDVKPEFEPENETEAGARESDDPSAVGRFVGEKDTVGAVPSYTRSKIRLAFKEQEVNSKTTWFSKLFRGDPPANFRIVPDETEEEEAQVQTPKLQWDQPPTRLPEPLIENDPELSHLLQRIKASEEPRLAPRPRPSAAVETEQAAPSESAAPFVERRRVARTVEIDQFRAAAAAPAFEANTSTPEAPVWETLAPAPPPAPIAAAPIAFDAPAEEPVDAQPMLPRFTDSRSFQRPLRPLTFQQLAGEVAPAVVEETSSEPPPPPPLAPFAAVAPELEATEPAQEHEDFYAPLEAAPEPVFEMPFDPDAEPHLAPVSETSLAPVADWLPAPVAEPHLAPVSETSLAPVADWLPAPVAEPLIVPAAEPPLAPVADWLPAPVAEPLVVPAAEPPLAPVADWLPAPVAETTLAEVPVVPSASEPPLPAPVEANRWAIPTHRMEPAPAPPARPAAPAVASAGHTGVPMWPAKEPMVSSYAPAFRKVDEEPAERPFFAASDAVASDSPERTMVEAAELAASRPGEEQEPEIPTFVPPSPSARRGHFERIPILPDPMSDPAPSPRPYRLETAPSVPERQFAPEHAAQVSAPAAAPAAVPAGISFPPDHEARAQMFNRRKTDRVGGDAEAAGLTRRWKLLSQFEPVVTDPLPAHRKGYTRSTDVNPPQRGDEG